MNEELQDFLNQSGLDLYDSLIKKYISNSIEKIGDIVESVPDEIIKMLWDGTIKFEDLTPVSGNPNYIPVSTEINYQHFLAIFSDESEDSEENNSENNKAGE